ncbi:hypothetical protein M0R72_08380 [Candidatus Pacearchaeota archaeon]|nr:hypothetical protein [Candidatus Pacearchaeota archaeon]
MNRIIVSMAPGEADRERSMRSVLSHDTRFEPLQIDPSIPVDLHFRLERECWIDGNLNMELKRPIDFVQSVLSGHLYDQTLSIRESGYNGCTVILGTLDEIYAAIDESNEKRLINGKFKFLNQDDRSNANASTLLRLKSFKKRSMLNGVPIFWKGDDSGFFDGDDQWKDILELAHDYLLDGDMLGFRMRPADNDREVAAASMLKKGIGSESMRILLKEYTLAFVPRGIYAKPIEELAGWGPKRCKQIEGMVRMIYK